MGRESMGDFDYVGKKTRTARRRAYSNSERVERLKGNNENSNGVKRLRYLTTYSDLVNSPENVQRFYNILSTKQKEIFGFLYINPLERILDESKYLDARTKKTLDEKETNILGLRGLKEELSKYSDYLSRCSSTDNRDLLKMTLNLKKENPRFVKYFLDRVEELLTKALNNKRQLTKSLDDLASIV